MRGLLTFLIIVAIVFFAVGEWQGWYLGVPPQTPVFVYKKTATTEQTRRTTTAQEFTFSLEGQLRRGNLIVEGYFERPSSFQTGRAGTPERRVFREEFRRGQRVFISETMKEGQGVYKVRLIFDDATGLLRLRLPGAGTL